MAVDVTMSLCRSLGFIIFSQFMKMLKSPESAPLRPCSQWLHFGAHIPPHSCPALGLRMLAPLRGVCCFLLSVVLGRPGSEPDSGAQSPLCTLKTVWSWASNYRPAWASGLSLVNCSKVEFNSQVCNRGKGHFLERVRTVP